MTQYTRTISRQVVTATSPLPTWVSTIQDPNTLYEVGGLPSAAQPGLKFPQLLQGEYPGNMPFYTGTDSNYIYKHFGYGGSVWASDVGTHGTLIFGGTGENVFDEQLTKFSLSDDTPAWSMVQNPAYALSDSQADTMNADWYYAPAEVGGITAIFKEDATWYPTWNPVYPCKYVGSVSGVANGWILRRRMTTSMLGNNRPQSFRYDHPVAVPASMTGNGNPGIVVNDIGHHGPFGGTRPYGLGTGPADVALYPKFWDASRLWPSGRVKYHLYWLDLTTGQWTVLPPIPDYSGRYGGQLAWPMGWLDVASKRITYLDAGPSGNYCLYHLNIPTGIAAGTVSSTPTTLTLTGNMDRSQQASGVWCENRRLYYFRNYDSKLVVVDVDSSPPRVIVLAVAGLPTAGDQWSFGYDEANQRVHITTLGASPFHYWFTIPADPAVAGNYTISSTPLLVAGGVTREVGKTNAWQYGQRGFFHPTLKTIFVTQHYNKMLAYKP